jgi:hypothetical protein
MRFISDMLQRLKRWRPISIAGDTVGCGSGSAKAEAPAGATPAPIPQTPEQKTEEAILAWKYLWDRYVRIRRQHGADGYVSHPGELEDAWNDLQGTFAGIELVARDPLALQQMLAKERDSDESDPKHGLSSKIGNFKRRVILRDLMLLMEAGVLAPKPDDDPDVFELRGRSRVDATFGNYLDRW